MKKILTLMILIGCCFLSYSQQSLSLRPSVPEKGSLKASSGRGIDFNNLTNWGLVGLGNLNLETFKDVNISGKISGYKRLNKSQNNFTTLHFSLNKNASNDDSLLATTLLFPDIGNASAAFTLEHFFKFGFLKNNNINMLGFFFDFSYKNVKAIRDEQEKKFACLGYTSGIKYLNWFHDETAGYDFVAAISVYLSVVNVPDEDNPDYRFLFDAPDLKSAISSAGVKIGIQINSLQFFADLKAAFGDDKKIPVQALRGFNANVGVIFNADVFEK